MMVESPPGSSHGSLCSLHRRASARPQLPCSQPVPRARRVPQRALSACGGCERSGTPRPRASAPRGCATLACLSTAPLPEQPAGGFRFAAGGAASAIPIPLRGADAGRIRCRAHAPCRCDVRSPCDGSTRPRYAPCSHFSLRRLPLGCARCHCFSSPPPSREPQRYAPSSPPAASDFRALRAAQH